MDKLKLKGTVSVILSDLPCKDVNAQFTTVPFKPLTDQGGQTFPYFFAETQE